MPPILELKNITKQFPGCVVANNNISFDLAPGEIHALLGENGAGKSTLMNILYGLIRPDEGEIYVKGELANIHSPKDAIAKGIGMVHQHFMLVPTMTVTQNIILGKEQTRGPFFLQREAQKAVAEITAKYGLQVSPNRKIWELSVGERQRVEIVKALYHGAEILVLDEPTAVLTPKETRTLFEILRSMVSQGISVIFISHKLEEVMSISNRISVLRRGKVIGTANAHETNEIELARMMVGREVNLSQIKVTSPQKNAPKRLLRCEHVSVIGNYGQTVFADLNLDLYEGEILGIAGVDGNGQTELAEIIAGLRPLAKGRLLLDDQVMLKTNPLECIKQGIAYIPVARKERGSVGALPLTHNITLKNHRRPPFSKRGILNHKEIIAFTEKYIEAFDVRCGNIFSQANTLSGGNLQKLIFAREISLDPKLIIAEQPTRGLDIGAIEYIRKSLIQQRAKGVGIILISADLDEIIALSDRIVVLYEGEINYMCERSALDMDQISLAMAGEKVMCREKKYAKASTL